MVYVIFAMKKLAQKGLTHKARGIIRKAYALDKKEDKNFNPKGKLSIEQMEISNAFIKEINDINSEKTIKNVYEFLQKRIKKDSDYTLQRLTEICKRKIEQISLRKQYLNIIKQ